MNTVARSIDAIWRIEAARIVATVARIVGDVGVAVDLPSAALVTAKHKAIDTLRRQQLHRRHEASITAESTPTSLSPDEAAMVEHLDDDVGDDLLRLMFVSCHPVLPVEQRLALTWRLFGGLTTDEIAHAFLVAETTIAQRIVRAKRALKDAAVSFVVPPQDERQARLSAVLEVIYRAV